MSKTKKTYGFGSVALIERLGYFSFFNFRLGTYNFPSGSSAPSLKRPKAWASAQREFDGTDGGYGTVGTDGTDGDQKCPSMFFILCWNIEHVYIYLYTKKNAANILMGFKIWCQVRGGVTSFWKLPYSHEFSNIWLQKSLFFFDGYQWHEEICERFFETFKNLICYSKLNLKVRFWDTRK